MSRTFTSAIRVLRVLKALKGNALHGLSNTELAQLTDDSPSNITRAMQTLIDEGLAVKLDTGRFAPGIALLQIAQAHAEEMARMHGRINEINQRVLAGAHH